jgi:8-oxo-dGTP diphosphatase
MSAEGTAAERRPEVCVGAVAVRGHDLLMVRRGNGPAAGSWSVPGGRVERGETLAEAVVRELLEETAQVGLCGPFLGWVERLDDDGHFVIMDFEVVVISTDEPVAGDDAAEARWVPVWEVPELSLVDGLAEFLDEHDIIETLT